MHCATKDVGAEGTVSKHFDASYRPGRSRHWLKAKHTITGRFAVAGWRPSSPSRPGGLILADADGLVGVATVSLPETERAGLVALIGRYGQRHPTGSLTIPPDCVTATVRYSSRTPTHGHLREAAVVAVQPA